MNNYRDLARWLAKKKRLDVMHEITHKSLDNRNFTLHEPWMLMWLSMIKEYLRNPDESPNLRNPDEFQLGDIDSLKQYCDIWVCLGCPGIDAEVAVTVMRENGLWDEFVASQSKNKGG